MAPPKVLVADDCATERTIVSRILSDIGLDVVTASDGSEAIERFRQEQPALAILDINMPHLSGYEVCGQLQDLGPPGDNVPVVFLTSDRSNALQLLGDQLGAYLQKPVDPDALIEVVHKFLPAEREQRSAATPAQSQPSSKSTRSSNKGIHRPSRPRREYVGS